MSLKYESSSEPLYISAQVVVLQLRTHRSKSDANSENMHESPEDREPNSTLHHLTA